MNNRNCLLCYEARCSKACGVMEPDRILRSLYFRNDAIVSSEVKVPKEDRT